jgi:hypothetical protein
MKYPSFEDLVNVVRDSLRLKRVERIDPDTQFVRDLRITETHRIDLLKKIEVHYGIEFTVDFYDRMPSESLFHAKKFHAKKFHAKNADEPPIIQTLFGASRSEVGSFTVGQLYKAVLRELNRRPEMPQKNSTKLHLVVPG